MTRNNEIPGAELEKRTALYMRLFMRGPSGCCNWPWGNGTPRPFHPAVRGRLPGWSPYSALRADAAGFLPARLPAIDAMHRICDAIPLDAVIAGMPGWEDEIRAIRGTMQRSATPWWAFARKDTPLCWVWCSVEPVHAGAGHSFLVLELAPGEELRRYAFFTVGAPGGSCIPDFERHSDSRPDPVVCHDLQEAFVQVEGMGAEGDFFVCSLPGRNDFMQALSTGPGRFRVEWQTWHPAWQVGCSRVSLAETKRLLALYWHHGVPGIECEADWTPLDSRQWADTTPPPLPSDAPVVPPELDDAADLPSLLALAERMDAAEEERLKARWLTLLPCDIWKMPPGEVVKTAVMLNRNPDLLSFATQFTFPSVRHVREGLWWEMA